MMSNHFESRAERRLRRNREREHVLHALYVQEERETAFVKSAVDISEMVFRSGPWATSIRLQNGFLRA